MDVVAATVLALAPVARLLQKSSSSRAGEGPPKAVRPPKSAPHLVRSKRQAHRAHATTPRLPCPLARTSEAPHPTELSLDGLLSLAPGRILGEQLSWNALDRTPSPHAGTNRDLVDLHGILASPSHTALARSPVHDILILLESRSEEPLMVPGDTSIDRLRRL